MKKWIVMLAAVLLSMNSHAALLTLELSSNTAMVGDSVDVTLMGSFDPATEAFDTFNLDVLFDDSLVSFVPGTLATGLANDDVISFFTGDSVVGGVSGVYTTFDAPYTGVQMLMSFSVLASSVGSTDFDLAIYELYDYFNFVDVIVEPVLPQTLIITEAGVPAVPAPGSGLLLLGALFAVARLRKG